MIGKIESGSSSFNPKALSSPAELSFSPVSAQNQRKKSIGEITPQIVNPLDYPHLIHLATEFGVIGRLRKKLCRLTGKKARLALAKGTVASADEEEGMIYLGVEFLEQHQEDTQLLAGVMAHEWGHLLSRVFRDTDFEKMSDQELLELRRQEELAADGFCGRILPLMGYSVEPLIEFLSTQQNQTLANHKYFSAEMRAEVLRKAAQTTLERQQFSRKLFTQEGYANPYHSILINP